MIDSLSGFELALAPTYREDSATPMYRMISVLTGIGVSVLATSELEISIPTCGSVLRHRFPTVRSSWSDTSSWRTAAALHRGGKLPTATTASSCAIRDRQRRLVLGEANERIRGFARRKADP